MPNLPNPESQGLGKKRNLVDLADVLRGQETDHDTAEADALAVHYAAQTGPDPPGLDRLAAGLFRGFHAHRLPASKERTHE